MSIEVADLTIVHPWDPWGQGIGGFDSYLDGFIRYAPPEWRVELVGLTRDPISYPVGQWLVRSFAGRPVRFYGALEEMEPDRVRPVPLSLRFALACRRNRVHVGGRIVQFHRFESAMGVITPALAKKVFFLHNHPEEIRSPHSDVRWHGLSGLHDYLLVNQLRDASAVVSVDPRTPEWVEARLPDLKGHVLYQNQWADPIVFHNTDAETRNRERLELRAKLGAAADAKVVLFVGRLELQKDPILLLEAFARLQSWQSNTWLAVVGKGRLEGYIGARARELGIGERVGLLGAEPREDLPRLYRGTDVLICTSGFEAGPLTVIETLACGTPVVSLNVGQVRHVLGSDLSIGRLVEERNRDAIARALQEVLEWPPSLERQARCAEAVASFTPQHGLAPVFDLYDHWLKDGVQV
jgi:glycosyltransferase involved in cell wall biosynthesis